MVFLYPHKTFILAVFNDILADLGKGDDKAVYRLIVIMEVFCKNAFSAVFDLANYKMDVVRAFNGRYFKENIRVGASKIFICNGDSPNTVRNKYCIRYFKKKPITI